jgi:hypothetical protein
LTDSTLIIAPADLPEELLVTMGDIMPTVSRLVLTFLSSDEQADVPLTC